MATLDQLLNDSLGLSDEGQNKTASQEPAKVTDDGINKLAAEIGLLGDEDINAQNAAPEPKTGHTKEAQMNNDLQDIYSGLYPDDADIFSSGDEWQNKTASMDKEAAEIEEAMGVVAHDAFLNSFDAQLNKIASSFAEISGKPGEAHPQKMDSNEDTSETKLNTNSTTQEEGIKAMSTSPKAPVGIFEKKKAPMGELKTAALRKHLIASSLDEQ